jgi:hypothetical protein
MINTERNRALLTDLFAAFGREGGVKCCSARFDPFCPRQIILYESYIASYLSGTVSIQLHLLGRLWSGRQNSVKRINPLAVGLTISRTLSSSWSRAK